MPGYQGVSKDRSEHQATRAPDVGSGERLVAHQELAGPRGAVGQHVAAWVIDALQLQARRQWCLRASGSRRRTRRCPRGWRGCRPLKGSCRYISTASVVNDHALFAVLGEEIAGHLDEIEALASALQEGKGAPASQADACSDRQEAGGHARAAGPGRGGRRLRAAPALLPMPRRSPRSPAIFIPPFVPRRSTRGCGRIVYGKVGEGSLEVGKVRRQRRA